MLLNLINEPLAFARFVISLLVAFSFHEAAHAYTALKLGDRTAFEQGRVSLNPLVHLDPLGTIFLLTLGFGWGKPVQINPNNFSNPKRDSLITALSGPFTNLALAIIFGIAIRLGAGVFSENLLSLLVLMIFINLILMIFNLLPIPPLDGSNIINIILPSNFYQAFTQVGTFILLGLIILSFAGLPIFEVIVYQPAIWLFSLITGTIPQGIL